MQNIWQHHCLPPGGWGGGLWDTCAHRARLATLLEFDVNYRFFTTSCDPNMGQTLKTNELFCLKKTRSMVLRRMHKEGIKLNKLLNPFPCGIGPFGPGSL
jgi:hypothetical protein